jgi:hypothetical protein
MWRIGDFIFDYADELTQLESLDAPCSQGLSSLAQFSGYALDDVAFRLVSELSGGLGPGLPS